MAVHLTSEREAEILASCQKSIGYEFRHPRLLRAALTHTSGAHTRAASLERLEFLGDSVLGLLVCEYLFRQFPDLNEGDMTKIKSHVVSRGACALFSQEIGLGQFMFLGRGLHVRLDVPSNMLADVFESVVGAIYLDGGLRPTREFVLRFAVPLIENFVKDLARSNIKSLLQQMAQKDGLGVPRYIVLDEQGPSHSRSYKVGVEIGGQIYAPAWGASKKVAETRAVENALATIENRPIPYCCD